jgi:hypothetical protein
MEASPDTHLPLFIWLPHNQKRLIDDFFGKTKTTFTYFIFSISLNYIVFC